MRVRAFSPKSATTFGLVGKAFWRMPFFSQNGVVQVPSKQPLQGDRDILPLGLFPLGLWVLDAFRSIS